MIKTKEQLKEILFYEAQRYKRKSVRCPLIELGERRILWKYNYILRHAEYHYNAKNRVRYLLYRMRLARLQCKYGVHIPINTCGKGLKIMHLGSILVNSNARIGENCTFHINTSIVAGGKNDDVPQLGNDIRICVGAVLLGGIKISDKCIIGANSVVNKSFEEEDITIAGVPARKISDRGVTEIRGGRDV